MDPNELLKQLGIDLVKDADNLIPIEKSIDFEIFAREQDQTSGSVLKAWIEDGEGNVLKDMPKDAEKAEQAELVLAGIASSTITDRHGDVMLPSSLIDMERAANSNLTMFLNHSYNVPEDVAGSVRKASVTSFGVDAEGAPIYDLDYQFRVNRVNKRAIESFHSIRGGTKLGLSIGARIPEGGAIRNKKTGRLLIAHVDLLETSIVGVPANPRSWIESAVKAYKSGGDTQKRVFTGVTLEEHDVPETPEPVVAASVTITNGLPEALGTGGTISGPSDLVMGEAGEETVITDSTTPSQEAPQSAPGSEGDVTTPDVSAAAEPPETPEDLAKADAPELISLLVKTQTALSETSMQLIEAQGALLKAEQRAEKAERERDMVAQGARDLALDTAQIIHRLGSLPVGQRASFRRITQDFNDGLESAKDIYGDEFVSTLRSMQK